MLPEAVEYWKYVQPVLEWLQGICTPDAIADELYRLGIVEGGKVAASNVSARVRKAIQENSPESQLPLNDDLRRGLRTAYLQAAVSVMQSKAANSKHESVLNSMIDPLKKEQDEVYGDDYKRLDIPALGYSEMYKMLPTYTAKLDDPVRQTVEKALYRELHERFGADEDALQYLRSTKVIEKSLFVALQNFFAESYKTNERLRAAFDGTMLVQLVSRQDVGVLKTLPEEIQQKLQTLWQELATRIAEENTDLAEKLTQHFDARTNAMLTGIDDLKQEIIREIHKIRAPTEHGAPYEPKRVVGAVMTLRAFTGRQDKLAELRQSVAEGKRLVQVCGPVGRGKTALATQFINKDNYFASIVFVTLRGRDPRVFESIVSLLLQTLPADKREELQNLQKEEADLLQVLSTLLSIIAEHKTLIVIDNLEDALEDGAFTEAYASLQAFVAGVVQLGGHSCQLLITSREPLDVASLGRDLGGGSASVEVSLEEGLNIEDGSALLRQLGDGKSGLKAATDEVLTRVVEQCDGIPLVLTNVAGALKRGRTLTLQRFLNMPNKLDDLRREPAKTLYDSLTANEQAVMRVLAVFGKRVPELAVRFLLPALDVASILLELETTYAVQFNDEGDTYSYALRPIDQEYAYGQLAEDERQNLHRKAAAFYRELRTPQESWQTLEDLQPQRDEFEQLVWAEAYDDACRVLVAIDEDYLFLWGHAVLVRDLHLKLHGRVKDKTLRMQHLSNLGLAYYRLGDTHQSIKCYEDALAIAREMDDRGSKSRLLGSLAVSYRSIGEVARTFAYYEEALAIAREMNDRHREGILLGNLGVAYRNLGDVRRAIEYHEQALVIARELGHRRGEGMRLNNLGFAYHHIGNVRCAIEYYEQALVIARELGSRGAEGIRLDNLGDAYRDLGDVRRAIEYHEQALAIARELGYRRGEGVCLGNLGKDYSDLGDVQRAIQHYQAGLDIVREVDYRQGEGDILNDLGLAVYKLGDSKNAMTYCRDALVIARALGYRFIESKALATLGLVHRDAGELDKMLACGVAALMTFKAIESPKANDVAAWLTEQRQTDFASRVQALFPDGDTILNEATGQNYTFFQDAPADMPERMLALIDQYAQGPEE